MSRRGLCWCRLGESGPNLCVLNVMGSEGERGEREWSELRLREIVWVGRVDEELRFTYPWLR
jgi:hypothetical protein